METLLKRRINDFCEEDKKTAEALLDKTEKNKDSILFVDETVSSKGLPVLIIQLTTTGKISEIRAIKSAFKQLDKSTGDMKQHFSIVARKHLIAKTEPKKPVATKRRKCEKN